MVEDLLCLDGVERNIDDQMEGVERVLQRESSGVKSPTRKKVGQ